MEENKNIEPEQPAENIPAAGPPQDSESGGEMEQSEIPPSSGTTNLPTGQAGYQPLNKWK